MTLAFQGDLAGTNAKINRSVEIDSSNVINLIIHKEML